MAAPDSGQINSDQPNSRKCRHGALAIISGIFRPRSPHQPPIGLRNDHARLVDEVAQRQPDQRGGTMRPSPADRPRPASEPGVPAPRVQAQGRPLARPMPRQMTMPAVTSTARHRHAGQPASTGLARLLTGGRDQRVNLFGIGPHRTDRNGHFARGDQRHPGAATPTAGMRGSVTCQTVCRGEASNRADSSTPAPPWPVRNRRSARPRATPLRHGSNWPRPSLPTGPAEAGQGVPPLQTEAGLPRRGLEIERHEEHQPQQRQPQPPPGEIGSHQQPGHRRPQRHARRAGRPGEEKRVEQENSCGPRRQEFSAKYEVQGSQEGAGQQGDRRYALSFHRSRIPLRPGFCRQNRNHFCRERPPWRAGQRNGEAVPLSAGA